MNDSPFVRPLTTRDCSKGFHDWQIVEKGSLQISEVCTTCGKKEIYNNATYDKNNMNVQDPRWFTNHKLDTLQPFGATELDFYEYYGRPDTRAIAADYKEEPEDSIFKL